VYDITRRDTFDNLSEVWLREVEMYSTLPDCVKMVVANKARAQRLYAFTCIPCTHQRAAAGRQRCGVGGAQLVQRHAEG
jgi:hypothetical protein